MTRRAFLGRVGRLGGAAMMAAMFALELLARDEGPRFRLEPIAPGRRRRVVVLGAGLAGLCAAYELRRAGFDCTVLESRVRPGGRCWTVRGGTVETELDGSTQSCRFAPGTYFNPGPMRVAHHHRTFLEYCREFGLRLVPFQNFNQAAYVLRAGQPRRRVREVLTDLRGYTSELLAKVVRRGELDRPLTAEDRERLIEYLRNEGRLDAGLNYPRDRDDSHFGFYPEHTRGYGIPAEADGGPGQPLAALDMETLLKAGYGAAEYQINYLHQQDTMLALAGGMDGIAHAFAERLPGVVLYEAEVREVRRTPEGGVRVGYADGAHGGGLREIVADWCIGAMPPHLMARVPSDLGAGTAAVLRLPIADSAGKIGLQFRRRFWEEDDDIYGGRSVTDLPISQIYYPCEGYGTNGPAVLIGYYHLSDRQAEFDHPPPDRERRALEQGALIHPQYPAEFQGSFSVEWHRVRHSEYAFAWWRGDEDLARVERAVAAGDGPFFLAGDWCTRLTGWQTGALVSGRRAARAVHARAVA